MSNRYAQECWRNQRQRFLETPDGKYESLLGKLNKFKSDAEDIIKEMKDLIEPLRDDYKKCCETNSYYRNWIEAMYEYYKTTNDDKIEISELLAKQRNGK